MSPQKTSIYKFIIFLMFVVQSCKNLESDTKQTLTPDSTLELENVFGSKDISFQKESGKYILTVTNTNLSTDLSKELAASNSAVILYSEIVKENSTLLYQTEIVINFSKTNKKYIYEIETVSNAIKAQEIVDNTINLLKSKAIISVDCNDSITSENYANWSTIHDYGFLGFTVTKEKHCNAIKNIISWGTFLKPQNKQLWFSIDTKNNKIYNIVQK